MSRFLLSPARGAVVSLETGFYYIWDPDVPGSGAWVKGGFPIESTGSTISDSERQTIEDYLKSLYWTGLPIVSWGVDSSGWWYDQSLIQFAVSDPESNSWGWLFSEDFNVYASPWVAEGSITQYLVVQPSNSTWVEFNYNYIGYHFIIGLSEGRELEVGRREVINVETDTGNWTSGPITNFMVP